MEIREATRHDSQQLVWLFQQEAEYHQRLAGYYELLPEFDWLRYIEGKLSCSNRRIFIAADNGSLAGFILIRIIHYPPVTRKTSFLKRLCRSNDTGSAMPIKPMRWGVIEDCFVLSDMRRQGLGTRLMECAMYWFTQQQIFRVELSIVADNREASNFWARLGFAVQRKIFAKNITGVES